MFIPVPHQAPGEFFPTAVKMHNDNLIYDRRRVFVLKQLMELQDGKRQESAIWGRGGVGDGLHRMNWGGRG